MLLLTCYKAQSYFIWETSTHDISITLSIETSESLIQGAKSPHFLGYEAICLTSVNLKG